jgi:hypothetical protein
MHSAALDSQRTTNVVALAETARNASAIFAIGAMLAHRPGQLKMPRPDAYAKRADAGDECLALPCLALPCSQSETRRATFAFLYSQRPNV